MFAVVDVQGFKRENGPFIVKELAILTNQNKLQHFIFQPPFSFKKLTTAEKRNVIWLQRNLHGFYWEDGQVPYHQLYATIKPLLRNETIYVKGSEKVQWMLDILGANGNILNIEDELTCGKIIDMTSGDEPSCLLHTGQCGLKNVFVIRNLLNNK